MNLKQLKRYLSLVKLGICELNGKPKSIIDFLNENLIGLNQYASNEYSDLLLFGKSKENIILEYDEKNGYLNMCNNKIWTFFVNDLSMEYTDILEIIQCWAVDTLKLKINYTCKFYR